MLKRLECDIRDYPNTQVLNIEGLSSGLRDVASSVK